MPSLRPTAPPPDSVTQPRTLNRWLDIRPQGGPLSRTHGYFNVPDFSIESEWRGFSIIVGAFEFSAENNFSLRPDVLEVPDNPNYTLCISWVDDDHNVFRYSLWRADGDLFNFGLDPYVGQLVKANFRLEIWNTETSPATNESDIVVYTTLLGNIDYMYGEDYTISDPSALCEGQAYAPSNTVTPTLTNCIFWWTAQNNMTPAIDGALVTQWQDLRGAYNLIPAVLGPTYHAVPVGNFTPKSVEFVSFTELQNASAFGQVQHLFFTFKTTGGIGKVLEFTFPGLVAIISQPSADTKVRMFLGISGTNTDDVLGTAPGVVEIIIGSPGSVDTINIYNALTRGIVQSTKSLTVYPFLQVNSLELGDQAAGGGFLMSDFLGYSNVLTTNNRNTTLEYLFNLFGTASAIPLTPAECAQPTPN